MVIATVSPSIADADFPTGEEWSTSSTYVKRAYVLGVANAVSAEYNVQQRSGHPPTNRQSAVPRFYRATEDTTVDEAVSKVDRWYADNPDKRNQEVIDVLWLIYVGS